MQHQNKSYRLGIVALIVTAISIFSLGLLNAETEVEKPAYLQAPFKGIDCLTTNDWWNRRDNKIIDLKVPRSEVVAFGMYTISGNILKLTAQLFPLYPGETRVIRLELFSDGQWKEVRQEKVNELGWSALFRLENWDDSRDMRYRLRHDSSAVFEGLIRKNPIKKDEIVVAALSCNSNRDREGRENIVRNILSQDPDIIFFSGDQVYDHKEHTASWLNFGMQFRETFRERPCISIPDDHDVGMFNLWGEGGKKGEGTFCFTGGYRFHPEYVKMVERCQTSHLPDPFDPTPIQQGIGVYYTRLLWGGIDFAIIEDRKFKTGPKGKVRGRLFRADHLSNKVKNPTEVDVSGLELLGERQEAFLSIWAKDKADHPLKVVLSQTAFFSGPHLHGKFKKRIPGDFDSNGWPQSGRNRALTLIQQANAIHIAGDQHLAMVVRQGVGSSYTGPLEFIVPAIVNTVYSRWWWPVGAETDDSQRDTLPWTGTFRDGFGNPITMLAYANPDSPSNGAGYGIVRLKKTERQVTFECWPRFCDVTKGDGAQFKGWPMTFDMNNNNQ